MERLLRGDHSHIDGAAQVRAEATASAKAILMWRRWKVRARSSQASWTGPRSVLIVALDDDDQVAAFAVAAPVRDGADRQDMTVRRTLGGQAVGT
jgi:hypothetical protein